MRLTATGNLGIGTNSPSGIFQAGISNAGIYFDVSTQYTPKIIAAGTISDIQIQSVGNGGNVYLNAPGTTSLIGMSVNGSERMRITSAGQIGVNTSSPVTTSLTGSITIYKSYNADQASVPSTTAQTYYSNQHGLYLFGRNSGLSIISANSEEGSIKFGNAGGPTALVNLVNLKMAMEF
jgi:hypothetical protein